MRYCEKCGAGTTRSDNDKCPRPGCDGSLDPAVEQLAPKVVRNRFGKRVPDKYLKEKK